MLLIETYLREPGRGYPARFVRHGDARGLRLVVKICLFSLLLGASALAQKRPITHEDMWLMKRTGEPVVSPDGRSIVFSLTEPDYAAVRQPSDLWVVPADGSAPPRRLTFTQTPETTPVW